MKAKTKSGSRVCEIKSNDSKVGDQNNTSSMIIEDSEVKNSGTIKHKKKRKEYPSSQDQDTELDYIKAKRKSKPENEIKNEGILSHLQTETFMAGESDVIAQDNTPESLKKKKKLKNKKKKANSTIAQPNNSTLDYLKKWKNDKSNWKFEKVRQIRLVSNMFDIEKLPDDYFPIFLEYMEGGSKGVKELVSKLANEVVDEMEKWESLSDEEKEKTPKVNESKYERARTVLQMIQ